MIKFFNSAHNNLRHSGRSEAKTRNPGSPQNLLDSGFRRNDGKKMIIEFYDSSRCFWGDSNFE
jgi:hypothetical protein